MAESDVTSNGNDSLAPLIRRVDIMAELLAELDWRAILKWLFGWDLTGY